ncbi:TRAP transporter large permease [Vibrio mediterranei]|uniref:TRAP transporter large permease n=1 Tax=Vibrio mediterranei TaxID=689 RepID=UPI00148CE7F4|nr:TRAP transporter large permease [Vibrio mediterranei]NOI23811.1 TRAP transporter large permease [Vibrio mediterranei]
MGIIELLIIFGVLMVLGIPISFAIILPSIAYMYFNGIPIESAVNRLSGSLNSFTIMAVPFFIIAGQLMNCSGLTSHLIAFTKSLVGHMRGGLAQVNIGASIIFAGMSGSAVADAGGLGSVLIKPMEKDGYSRSFSSAVTAASSTIGPIIPPSIPMVIYGVIAEESIGRLFLAGAVPGVVLGILMMVMLRFMPQTKNVKVYEKSSLAEVSKHARKGIFGLLMPVIVIGGVTGGIFTPTEAAAIAAIYALFIGFLFNKGLNTNKVKGALVDSMILSANVLFIVAAAGIFGWLLARSGATGEIALWIDSLGVSNLQLLLLINVIALLMGCVLEPISILIILTPVLLPIVSAAGIDPVHFGVVLVFNLMIGLVTPPMGLVLYVVSDIGRTSLESVVKDILPFFVPMLLVLLLITAFPAITLALPDYVFG